MKKKIIALVASATLVGGVLSTNLVSARTISSNCQRSYNVNCSNIGTKNIQNKVLSLLKANNANCNGVKNIQSLCDGIALNCLVNDNKTPQTNNVETGNNKPVQAKPQVKPEVKPQTETGTKPQTETQNVAKPGTEVQAPSKPETQNTVQVAANSFEEKVSSLIFEKTNAERVKAGLPALEANSDLNHYASFKSQDMGVNNYFDHTDLNGNYITEKMSADGFKYSAWGENIAYISGSNEESLAQEFVTNWMNSPGHRANILSSDFKALGVGIYKAGDRVYATQEFYRQ